MIPEDQCTLLDWYYQLNHTSFKHIKYLALQGILPKKLQDYCIPKCPACIYGKATRRRWHTKGSLKTNLPCVVTQPGKCVSVNTLQSPTLGLVAQAKGTLTNCHYNYATVFVDQYSALNYVHIHQTNSSDEILVARLAFKQFALTQCPNSALSR
jgi:hypothetical protein